MNNKILFNIYQLKNLSNQNFVEILEYIVLIGKINIITSMLDKFFIDKIKYNKIFVLLTSLITYHKTIVDEFIYITLTKPILLFLNNVLPLFELTEIVNSILIENYNDCDIRLGLIIDFYVNVLNNYHMYFNILAINNSIEILYIITKNKLPVNNKIFLINKLKELISSNYLNIHEKINLFIDITKILLKYTDNIDNTDDMIYDNFINQIYYVFDNIDFLEWMNIDEKIDIFELISKIFVKLKKINKLTKFENDDNLLFYILNYENICFNILTKILETNVDFSIYNLMKKSAYNLMTIINIFIDIEDYYLNTFNTFNTFDKKYISDLFYKNNLNTTVIINYLLDKNNLLHIVKFNSDILIKNIVISKLILIYKYSHFDTFPYIGIEYENYEKYINDSDMKLFNNINNIDNKLLNLRNKYDEMNKKLD